MCEQLDDFKKVIRECDYSNTYKMAWAKGIVELSNIYNKSTEESIDICLVDIAKKMFKYYWDQTIFFNLFQSAPNQPPVILQEVKKLIELYQISNNDYKPIVFERAFRYIEANLLKEYNKSINNCVRNIKVNVMPFFLNLEGKTFDFYRIDKMNNKITIKLNLIKALYKHQQDLFDLINYRWSLMLENYNSCPRIAKKVRIIDEQEVKRKDLKIFDEFLELENDNHICFICGKKIEDADLSRDHVIPWSYIYSDDLWNLVYVHKGCNSGKSNITPSQERIDKLKERNLLLQAKMHDKFKSNSKILQEFDYAIKNDFVDKFYLGCKGC